MQRPVSVHGQKVRKNVRLLMFPHVLALRRQSHIKEPLRPFRRAARLSLPVWHQKKKAHQSTHARMVAATHLHSDPAFTGSGRLRDRVGAVQHLPFLLLLSPLLLLSLLLLLFLLLLLSLSLSLVGVLWRVGFLNVGITAGSPLLS